MRITGFSRIRRQWLSGGIATVLTALLGLALLYLRIGGGLTRLGYDLPFASRSYLAAEDAVVVYLDEASHTVLNQPRAGPWDRSLHARLVERLTAAGAKAIVFDILFTEPSANAAADADFARAIKQSGRVILSGNFNGVKTEDGLLFASSEELPYEPFRAGAAAWGNANLVPDPDYGVRRSFPDLQDFASQRYIPWLPRAVASFAAGKPLGPQTGADFWLNYYGPVGTIPFVSYSEALQPEGAPPGFFKGKLVFVGAARAADIFGKDKDEFRTPFTLRDRSFAPGVEIHATATLNLLHQNWLTRLPSSFELTFVLLIATLAGFGLMRLQPLAATCVGLATVLAVALAAHLLFCYWSTWFAWLIPALEIGVALFFSVILNSLLLYVEKRLLEQSLAAHLSPKLVRRLLNDPALRQPGGSQQEVSILFSDIGNFSRVSACLSSDDLVRLMNRYYEAALRCIHETDGTIISLLGDAIFAIWNAPIEQSDHRERACRAAVRLREDLAKFSAAEPNLPLNTRIGLHAGAACVGNIGSQTHFEYTALGDNTNLASRLENLNRRLGTEVLVTREIQRAVEQTMVWRLVGHFKLKGPSRMVEVYELVGPPELDEPSRAWRELFQEALQYFRRRNFDGAAERFEKVISLRRASEQQAPPGTAAGSADGPSSFYLAKIAEFRSHPPAADWIGEIELEEK